MLIRIRHRLACEDGISLVEMMISMLILSVGLMALLGSFMVSARSVLDQRAKATGTRVVSEELETLRDHVWRPGFVAPSGTRTVARDGRDYRVTTTVTNSTNPPGMKDVATTVAWSVAGVERTATSQTSVSSGVQAPETVATDAHITVEMSSNPVRVWPTGSYHSPSGNVTVRANVVGMEYAGDIRLTWQNANGTTGTNTIVKSSGKWEKAIPGSSFIVALNPQLEGALRFTVDAVTAPGLTTSYDLTTLGYNDVDMRLRVLNSSSQNLAAIRVTAPSGGGSCNGNRCQNLEIVHFVLSEFPPATSRALVVWYANGTGYSMELRSNTLTYPGMFAEGISANGAKFQPNSGSFPGPATFSVYLVNSSSQYIDIEGNPCGTCSHPFQVQVVVG